jgi:hypothetical protein
MTPWSRQQALDLWEQGMRRHPVDRALLLGSTERSGYSPQELADVPIGALRQLLLAVRCANFGQQLIAYVDCPSCAVRLELTLDADALRCQPPPSWIDVDGLRVRLPTSRDLAAAVTAPGAPDEEAMAHRLVMRHLSDAMNEGHSSVAAETAVADTLSPEMMARIDDALAQVDGAADAVLDFSCDECGHVWQTPFDIAEYLWQELDVYARRLLLDVHVLARAYGWPEREVLALTDTRRAAYLAMVTA